MARNIDIVQKTEINVSFFKEVSKEDREQIMNKMTDEVYTTIKANYPKVDPSIDWKETETTDCILLIEEVGTIKYYPSNSYYDPEEWDDPTTIQEEDFEAIMDELYGESENISGYYVNSDWEVE